MHTTCSNSLILTIVFQLLNTVSWSPIVAGRSPILSLFYAELYWGDSSACTCMHTWRFRACWPSSDEIVKIAAIWNKTFPSQLACLFSYWELFSLRADCSSCSLETCSSFLSELSLSCSVCLWQPSTSLFEKTINVQKWGCIMSDNACVEHTRAT